MFGSTSTRVALASQCQWFGFLGLALERLIIADRVALDGGQVGRPLDDDVRPNITIGSFVAATTICWPEILMRRAAGLASAENTASSKNQCPLRTVTNCIT